MSPRRPNDFLSERVTFTVAHGELTATTTLKVFQPLREFLLESVRYINPTGLVADVTNFMALSVKNAAVVAAGPFSTETGEEGSIAADTFTEIPVSAVAGAAVFAADDVLSLVFTEGGAVTLPPGTFQIEGRYL